MKIFAVLSTLALSFFLTAKQCDAFTCNGITITDECARQILDGQVQGDEFRLSNGDTVTIEEIDALSSGTTECQATVVAQIRVRTGSLLGSVMDGHVWVDGGVRIDFSNNQFCMTDPLVQRVEFKGIYDFAESNYERLGRNVIPNPWCVALANCQA